MGRTFAFDHISVSTSLTQTIKFLDRGDTTVVDAYLSPAIQSYLSGLRAKISAVDLRVMTSAGGLVNADRFLGKDSILSGPAGGVIGYSNIAAIAGFKKSIGFDMGGTSTDVSRFNGGYEYNYRVEKNGVRIVAPMLEIETIAAGGGSICRFDGQKLTVGPDSAGAYPGPCCYGNNGPLTLTDINLFNGKIDDAHFPLPLDYESVKQKLLGLSDVIYQKSSLRYSPWELAHGLTKIAVEKMASAIKKISSARGFDTRDYVIVTFGGAGGQHACAIADCLGMNRILLHPLAGVLSALGMGMADVRKFVDRTVLLPLSDTTLTRLEPQFEQLEKQLFREILEEGVPANNIRLPIRLLDLRYQGEESTITVKQPQNATFQEAFEHHHQQLYGYVHHNRKIEIVTIRIEIVGNRAKSRITPSHDKFGSPGPEFIRSVYFGGNSVKTEIYVRDRLQPGDKIAGPAIISESYSTIVIDPGWQGEVTAHDTIVLTRKKRLRRTARPGSIQCDPIRLELFTNQFFSIASQMGTVLTEELTYPPFLSSPGVIFTSINSSRKIVDNACIHTYARVQYPHEK